jgi:CRISPR-associated protein Cas5d
MLDNEVVSIKVEGEFACFTRPDLKVERMSYPCMTPSAARGILDSILWKPEFKWYVRRINVLKPVKYMSFKRNEINSKQNTAPLVVDELNNQGKPKNRSQRNSIILKDVAYIIEASLYVDEYSEKNPPRKYVEMFKRRVKKGQCFRRPYLGTREFAAEFMLPDNNDVLIQETIPIGSMLFDIFYNESGLPEPVYFFDVAIKEGVLDCEVPENDRLMKSSHIQPPLENEIQMQLKAIRSMEE